MNTEEHTRFWDDLKTTWNAQAESHTIRIEVDQLIQTFSNTISDFEKQAITKDWKRISGAISDFEKESIQKDLTFFITIWNNIKKLWR